MITSAAMVLAILSETLSRIRPSSFLSLIAAALLIWTSVSQADLILDPAGASTDMGSQGPFTPVQTINQSGLDLNYVSLVDDFDTYIALDPTHSSLGGDGWESNPAQPDTGNFDFDLGGSYVIESFALWNLGGNLPPNLADFVLLADDSAAFSSPVTLGTFTANANTGPVTAVLPEVFTFSPTQAAFVRMEIMSNSGGVPFTGFGEAAFEVQGAAPEPATLALLGIGLTALGFSRRKSKQ